MTYNWFECKINYEKMMENGLQKNVTESYLIDSLSFTEAEERIIKEIKPYIPEFSIADISKRKFSETFFGNGDMYYKARLLFLTLDEKSGTEKKTGVNMLIQANSLKEALEIVETEMKKTMIDYAFHSIIETAIIDVFPYKQTESCQTT